MAKIVESCPVDTALQTLSGKWRLLVLFRLGAEPQRFNALQRAMAPITQKVLTSTLRALESDGLVWRKSENSVPPNVTYGLTPKGVALAPVFAALANWQLQSDWPATGSAVIRSSAQSERDAGESSVRVEAHP